MSTMKRDKNTIRRRYAYASSSRHALFSAHVVSERKRPETVLVPASGKVAGVGFEPTTFGL